VPSKLAQTKETAVISRDSLAFEVTRWAQRGWVGDPYEEGTRQIVIQAQRAMDRRITAEIFKAGVILKSRYVASGHAAANYLDWDFVIQGRASFGDEDDEIVGMVMNSAAKADVLRLKDTTGRPLMVPTTREGDFDRLAGIPIHVSDKGALTGSSMGTVVPSGPTPPAVTLTGEPLGAYDLIIDIIDAGARGVATFRFSTDGGATWSATMTTAAAVVLTDSGVDSMVGENGTTGVTANFATGNYDAGNQYNSKTLLKAKTALLRRGAAAFWYNAAALVLQTDRDILADTSLAAMHLYAAAHRYRRTPTSTRPGVVVLEHNVSAFIG
jgi:Phage capsid family